MSDEKLEDYTAERAKFSCFRPYEIEDMQKEKWYRQKVGKERLKAAFQVQTACWS